MKELLQDLEFEYRVITVDWRGKGVSRVMDLERRIELITRPPVEEVITLEDLRRLLETTEHPVAYDGFEPSGLAHIALGLLRPIKLQDLLDAGCRFKLVGLSFCWLIGMR